ncbi:putative nuclear pore complex protein [Trypoxylus dichotomus]
MISTDFLCLNDHQLFKDLRETLPKNIKKTQNIMCVKDDVLYTWDLQDNCILTLNIKAARSDESEGVIHQKVSWFKGPDLLLRIGLKLRSHVVECIAANGEYVLAGKLAGTTFLCEEDRGIVAGKFVGTTFVSKGGEGVVAGEFACTTFVSEGSEGVVARELAGIIFFS